MQFALGVKSSVVNRVRVLSPSRLHCGLLNESGLGGWVDGGFGFSLCNPLWDIELERGPCLRQYGAIAPEHAEAIETTLRKLFATFGEMELSLRIYQSIASHVGLGSKTSLVLAIACAFTKLLGIRIDLYDLASMIGRAGTSGIGLYSTSFGGFIRDAGHRYPSQKKRFGPSSMKLALPPQLHTHHTIDWLQVVHFRYEEKGLHGDQERAVFTKHCPLPDTETVETIGVADIACKAVSERNNEILQRCISRLQEIGLKRVEWNYQKGITRDFRRYWSLRRNPHALGLSSMGPTLYCLTSTPDAVLNEIRAFGECPIHCEVARISNCGIISEILE